MWKGYDIIFSTRKKTYFYLLDDGSGDKKPTRTKKFIIKWRLKILDYKKCLQNNKTVLRSSLKVKQIMY